MTPDPKNCRDALLTAGYSFEETERMLRAADGRIEAAVIGYMTQLDWNGVDTGYGDAPDLQNAAVALRVAAVRIEHFSPAETTAAGQMPPGCAACMGATCFCDRFSGA